MPRSADMAAKNGRCNAETISKNPQDQAPKGTSAIGPALLYRGDQDNLATPEDERYDVVPYGVRGTGAGSDVNIFFDPDAYLRSSCDKHDGLTRSDEVLFHEMIHALRNMQGKTNHIPTDDSGYDNDEEFLAIVATNVYISAGGGVLIAVNLAVLDVAAHLHDLEPAKIS